MRPLFTGFGPRLALPILLAITLILSPGISRSSGFAPFLTPKDHTPLGTRIPLILIHGVQSVGGQGYDAVWNDFLTFFNSDPDLPKNYKPYAFVYETIASNLQIPPDPKNIQDLGASLRDQIQAWDGSVVSLK